MTADSTSSPTPVADLHCDLLDYLYNHPEGTPYDPQPRCSIPQLRAGNVAFQTLAIFGVTADGSAAIGPSQSRLFERLVREHPDELAAVRSADDVRALPDGRTGVVAAIENASVFCGESESLDAGLARFEEIERRVGRVLYVSLTWNHENRFGGGNESGAGLKPDGRTLLDYLSGRRIALDFSHASHRLAREAIDFIERRRLELPLLASHSCFAALVDIPRNLPDDVARQIIAKEGVIGLNFLRPFLGETPRAFAEHVRHALELGGARSYCFGADFFTANDVPRKYRSLAPHGFFFPDLGNAGCYPRVLEMLANEVPCSEDLLRDLAHRNLVRFFDQIG